jgi:hypothetical protein
MERVLQAEQDSETAMLAAKEKSADLLQQAAAQAARIALRGQQRTVALNARCARSLDEELARLEREHPLQDEGDPRYQARLERAVERVCIWLTTNDEHVE